LTSYDLDESVETACAETDCDAAIHCGDQYLCGGCEDFFCDEHMVVIAEGERWTQVCVECDREEEEEDEQD
jgi:hypothetical protein